MLCAIFYGRVPSCQNQAEVVHLVSTAQAIDDYGLDFAFTDGHAIMAFTEFYDDLDDLQGIDWEVMKAKYWSDTLEDGDRKRRRQAEFLVHGRVPWSLVTEIAVMNRSVEKKVKSLLEREATPLPCEPYGPGTIEAIVMIELRRGNILEVEADALVNTVNCVGVMGKGNCPSIQE